jgi:hypothetical protein
MYPAGAFAGSVFLEESAATRSACSCAWSGNGLAKPRYSSQKNSFFLGKTWKWPDFKAFND